MAMTRVVILPVPMKCIEYIQVVTCGTVKVQVLISAGTFGLYVGCVVVCVGEIYMGLDNSYIVILTNTVCRKKNEKQSLFSPDFNKNIDCYYNCGSM